MIESVFPVQRVVAIHAHPDDETLFTGAALAAFARAGVDVLLLTMTLGEAAETANIAAASRDDIAAAGRRRLSRLTRACAALGISHRRLGGEGKWIDAGRSACVAGSLSTVDSMVLVEALVAELTQFRPQLVLSVGADGVTKHPDHMLASVVAREACQRAFSAYPVDGPELSTPLLLGVCVRQTDVQQAHQLLAELTNNAQIGSGGIQGIADTAIDLTISAAGIGRAKQTALDQYIPGMGTMTLAELLPQLPRYGDTLLLRATAEVSQGGWDEECYQIIDYANSPSV